jgi:lipoate-protein ligase B
MDAHAKPLWVVNAGRIKYGPAFDFQREIVAARKTGAIPDVLLFCEHPHVITLGRNGAQINLLAGRKVLQQMNIEFHETDRGGDITYHGPGQIVGYPILDLTQHRRDVRWYVEQLEEVMIRAAADYGISARRILCKHGIWIDAPGMAGLPHPDAGREPRRGAKQQHGALAPETGLPPHEEAFAVRQGTAFYSEERRAAVPPAEANSGVSTPEGKSSDEEKIAPVRGEEKLAALGVHLSRWVTSHGFAFNVSTDLRYFDLIVPCGLVGKRVTSLERALGRAVSMDEARAHLLFRFAEVFAVAPKSVSLDELRRNLSTPALK